MRGFALILFSLTAYAGAQIGSDALACQSGKCSGYNAPSGGCNTGAYVYTDLSATPATAYACLAGGWVVQGGGGGGATPAGSTGQVQTNAGGGALGAITSTAANTPSTLVQRASDGSFAAGAITSTSILSGSLISTVLNPDPTMALPGTANRFPGQINTICQNAWAGNYQVCGGLSVNTTSSAPGYDLGSNSTSATGWWSVNPVAIALKNFTRGISNLISAFQTHYAMGDTIGMAIYQTVFGGQTQSADEGVVGVENHILQLPYLAGTLSAGATTGSNLITATISSGQSFSDGGIVLDTRTASYTATLATSGSDSTLHGLFYTTTGATFPVSSAYGSINPATCTNNGNGQGQVTTSTTCGMTAITGTFVVSSGANQHACSAATEEEEFQITAVTGTGSSQTITFNTRYAWNGTVPGPVFQNASGGGLCGKSFVDTSVLSTWPIAYMALGATSSSTVYFGNCRAGSCNGTTGGNILATGKAVTFYPSAEIIGTNGGTSTQANLGYNSIPFVVGDSLIGAPTSEFSAVGIRNLFVINTPSLCNNITQGCSQHIGETFDDAGTSPLDIGLYFDNPFGLSNPTKAMIYASGAYQQLINSNFLPADSLIRLEGNFLNGQTSNITNLFAYTPGSAGGSYQSEQFRTSDGLRYWSSIFQAAHLSDASLAGGQAICANGTAGNFTTSNCTAGFLPVIAPPGTGVAPGPLGTVAIGTDGCLYFTPVTGTGKRVCGTSY